MEEDVQRSHLRTNAPNLVFDARMALRVPETATTPESGEPLPELPLRWSGSKSTRRDYAALCDIPLDITRDELDHRIEVFGEDPNFGSRMTFIGTA